MDTEVLEFDIGVGGCDQEDDNDDLDIDHNHPNNHHHYHHHHHTHNHHNHVDDEEMADSPFATPGPSFGGGSTAETYLPEGDLLDLEPYEGMEFESEEASKAFYNSYARRVGFSTRVSSSRRSRRDGAIIQRQFVCAKEGFRNPNEKRTKDREIKRPRTVTRVGCKASLSVKMQDSGKWVVSGFVREHNHELVAPDQVHCLRSHRQISGSAKTLIDTLQAAGMGPRRIMSALIKECGGISKVGFTEVDCRNYMRNNRQRTNEGDTLLLLDYLRQMRDDNPGFFYAVQGGDDEASSGNVFWADPKARANYAHFGDTVTFDTTYRSNRYRLPFAPFAGVNHHGQPVLFGCAFLTNESEPSFIWLFETWLSAMSGRPPPVSITTDHDSVIRSAVTRVLPATTRHRFCKWHIFKKCQERLSHVFSAHPGFESDFHKCVNSSESTEEFESCWISLLDRYELRDHEWLGTIYSERSQWVPVYLRDSFFAEVSTAQRSDGMNSFFDGYINASTSLGQFCKLYEKALESRNEKEVKADFDTMNTAPVLKTPSPMEKQVSELYTRKLFTRFQEELVGTLSFMASKADDDGDTITFLVSKYGEDHKPYFVKFSVLEMKAACSCQMFEFSGLLCRHVLAVFKVTNLLTLPSHYVLKRWTRNAKSSVVLEEHNRRDLYTNYLESHTVRYNTLRHEVFKFVDDGAKSSEAYGVAMSALKEASERIARAVKNSGKNTNVNGRVRGNHSNSNSNVGSSRLEESSAQQMSEDDMDKRIRELKNDVTVANRKCEVYRANLLSVLKDIEDHKLQLSIKVQNVKISMKDGL